MCGKNYGLLRFGKTCAVVDAEVSRAVRANAHDGTKDFASRTAVGLATQRCAYVEAVVALRGVAVLVKGRLQVGGVRTDSVVRSPGTSGGK